MTLEKLNDAIKKRAHAKVKKRIKEFQDAVTDALAKLFDDGNQVKKGRDELNERAKEVVLILLKGNWNVGWPAKLWSFEEERVQEEIFSTMDVVQQALVAPTPDPNDPSPAAGPDSGK
jgi:hypothetical protein